MSILAGQPQASIEPMMLYMGRLAREAARALALASTEQKNAALEAMAKRIEARSGAILEANRNDIDAARGKGRDEPSSTGWRSTRRAWRQWHAACVASQRCRIPSAK